jgi:hypothetical protein
LNGFLELLYLLPELPAIANVVTSTNRSIESSAAAARCSRSSAYSSSSQILCRAERGSFMVTGNEMVERSLPTFFLSKPSMLNSSPAIGCGS